MYTPKKTVGFEQLVAMYGDIARADEPPFAGPTLVTILAVVKRPKRLMRKKDPETRMWCCTKPDADNICKSVLDGLVMGGVITDDKNVVSLQILKQYAAKDEGPCTEVSVTEAT